MSNIHEFRAQNAATFGASVIRPRSEEQKKDTPASNPIRFGGLTHDKKSTISDLTANLQLLKTDDVKTEQLNDFQRAAAEAELAKYLIG